MDSKEEIQVVFISNIAIYGIAIDEAHNYLPCKQPALEKLVREAASKGVAIILMSQSPDDFDQPKSLLSG